MNQAISKKDQAALMRDALEDASAEHTRGAAAVRALAGLAAGDGRIATQGMTLSALRADDLASLLDIVAAHFQAAANAADQAVSASLKAA